MPQHQGSNLIDIASSTRRPMQLQPRTPPGGLRAGAGAAVSWLDALPDHLVAALWPADRVLHGFAVGNQGLARALRSAQKVDLKGLGLGGQGAGAVAGMLGSMTSLRELDLGSNMLGEDGAKAVARALQPMTNLRKLHLYNNGLKDAGLEALVPRLPRTLQYLDLGVNDLGAKGMTALGRFLASSQELVCLDLGTNKLYETGAKVLGRNLPSGVKHLNLGDNGLGAAGVEALGSLPPGLLHLDLTFNFIGPQGALRLVNNLPPSLLHLELGTNFLGAEGAEALGKNVPPSLCLLDLRGNGIKSSDAEDLGLPVNDVVVLCGECIGVRTATGEGMGDLLADCEEEVVGGAGWGAGGMATGDVDLAEHSSTDDGEDSDDGREQAGGAWGAGDRAKGEGEEGGEKEGEIRFVWSSDDSDDEEEGEGRTVRGLQIVSHGWGCFTICGPSNTE